MATNYGSLKQCEEELIQKFYEYLEHTYQMHLTVLLAFKNVDNQELFKKDILKVYELEKISNITQADLLDECTWIISKEQPQASHLRFVIAILNSINDLERICDYANNIAKFLEKHVHIDHRYLDIIKVLEALATENYDKVFDHFKHNDAVSTYRFTEQLQGEFTQEFHNQLMEMRKLLSSNTIQKDQNDSTIDVILVLKNVERIMDHVMNIIEYFIYIKECNFFFTKRI